MTWSEINQALPGLIENGDMSATRAGAIQGLFQVFDSYGDMNYALSEQEAMAGV